MKKIFLVILMFFVINYSIDFTGAVQTVSYNFDTSSTNDLTYAYPNLIKDNSLMLQIYTTGSNEICKYSEQSGKDFNQLENNFDLNYQTLHRILFDDLDDGVYNYYIKCQNGNNISKQLGFTFNILNPVEAKISLSKNTPISAGVLKINLETTKTLSQKPLLSYSLDGGSYSQIPLSGGGNEWEAYIIIPSTVGEAVGSFKFKGIDMDGNVGEDIYEGEIFLVDTIMPSTVSSLIAIGQTGKVKLEWRFDEEVDHYNIYKANYQGVDYSDYYQKTESKSFVDNNVEKGKTYYYKINAVDKAGNEGDLSYEVWATALINDQSEVKESENQIPTGLPSELLGRVDAFIYEIDSVKDDLTEIRNKYSSNSVQNEVMKMLKLGAEFDNSESELENLESEVSNYKQQNIDRVELVKKIDNSKLKLNIIKKKIPESITILEERSFDKKPGEEGIKQLLMSINNGQLLDSDSQKIEKSLDYIDRYAFTVKTKAYNLKISYLDGDNREIALIKEEMSINTEDENVTFVENVPKEIAEKSADINIKNNNYEILKDDPVISFSSDNKEIIYYVEKNIDLNKVKDIGTFLIYNGESENNNVVTGFFAFNSVKPGEYTGLILLTIAVLGLFMYFIFFRRNKKDISTLNEITNKIIEAEIKIKSKDILKAKEIYNEISIFYKTLNDEDKKHIYPEIESLLKKIKGL